MPKTRLEADKDFWEAKRAADHLEGNAEKAMRGEHHPDDGPRAGLLEGRVPARRGRRVITPMNFIYGIPGIQIIGCYLSGLAHDLQGPPLQRDHEQRRSSRMLLAAGADPRAIHKLEGFGGDIAPLDERPRVAVVSVTGSAETAKTIQAGRGVRPVRFEGGGLQLVVRRRRLLATRTSAKIAARLTYSKLGFGSHKCTSAPRHRGDQGDARPPRAARRRRR